VSDSAITEHASDLGLAAVAGEAASRCTFGIGETGSTLADGDGTVIFCSLAKISSWRLFKREAGVKLLQHTDSGRMAIL